MPRLLVVDDNPLTLHFFSDALATLGIECATAASAAEAVQRAAASTFDLLLIDVHLPDMHGARLLEHIRAGEGASRRVTALATTAATGTDAELLAAGFADVLKKPIGVATLHARLHRHLAVGVRGALLDEGRARDALGDARLIAPLRGLLARELETVPGEFSALARDGDRTGMRDRLHRLAASAGLCGALALGAAIAELEAALAADGPCHAEALTAFLAACAATHEAIVALSDALPPAPTT